MASNLDLAIELENIKHLKINEVFEEDGLLFVGAQNNDTYYAIDCIDDYKEWYIDNIASDEDFLYQDELEDDGYISKNKYLNDEIDYLNVNDFSQYVRFRTNYYPIICEDANIKIELTNLIDQLNVLKYIDMYSLPEDYRSKLNTVLLICRNIGKL